MGSSDAGNPAAFSGFNGPLVLGANLTVDVTGAAAFRGTGVNANLGDVTSFAPINVALGGSLAMVGGINALDAIHIASGTLDLSRVTTSTGTPVG